MNLCSGGAPTGCLGPDVALFFFIFPLFLLGVTVEPMGWLLGGCRIWGCPITLHNPRGSQGSVAEGPSPVSVGFLQALLDAASLI